MTTTIITTLFAGMCIGFVIGWALRAQGEWQE